jgi:ribosomal protein S14
MARTQLQLTFDRVRLLYTLRGKNRCNSAGRPHAAIGAGPDHGGICVFSFSFSVTRSIGSDIAAADC